MLIEIASVSVSFGGRRVLDGVSLDVDAGSSVAIVGPSGSGKTTLAYCIAGALRPHAGSVRVAGRDPRRLRDVALIQQTTNAVGRRSCRDNVAMGSLARGATRRRALADAESVMSQVGLAAVAARKARNLSGGELQRVAIARALAMDARVIVADEPTGQLDEATSHQIVDVLLSTVSVNRALILMTHDLDAAGRCDRVLRLSDGRLRDGTA